jgi:membrane protein
MTNDRTPGPGHAARSRLSATIRAPITWLMSRWPGRVVLGSAAGMARIEIFDRAMTIAAQFFTSVFPIIIMAASWLGREEFERVSQSLDVPPQTRAILSDALHGTNASFGLVGVLVVLISATSLSRALTRAFCAVWKLERSPRRLFDAWRWLAVVVVLALTTVVTRLAVNLVQGLPPKQLWSTTALLAIYTLIAILVPWLLMAGRVRVRSLVPGGILFAIAMLAVRPASTVYLSLALKNSAERYGSIGVAFTYLTWLYIISFIVLLTAVIGQVVTSDDGSLGRFIRRRS